MKNCADLILSPADVTPLIRDIQTPRVKLAFRKRNIRYVDCICAFDIETSVIYKDGQPHSIMYMWQWQVGFDYTIIGRTWEELKDVMATLSEYVDEGCRVVVYVHNLSYEFQFLKSVIGVSDVFARDRRTVVSFCSGKFEFRCSYIHSNMSLSEYTRKMNVQHAKLDDTVDYNVQRWPDSDLDAAIVRYAAYDVMGVVEAIGADMEIEGDDLYTIPLTSTGYVRREAKRVIRKSRIDSAVLKPPYEVYRLERQAFRGGDTHANRYYAGVILEDVHSVDLSSCYPAQQCMMPYPVGAWVKGSSDWAGVSAYLRHGKPFLCSLQFSRLRLRDPSWGCPYISISKCLRLANYDGDNGRVVAADLVVVAVTDIDLRIILDEYEWDSVSIIEIWASSYGKLPDGYIKLIQRYYTGKTELKGVEGREVHYMKHKNKINSFYGMTAQNPVIDEYVYASGEIELEACDSREKYEKARIWLPYAWGVWCTAYARRALHLGIKLVGRGFVYCDTDSIKYLGNSDFFAQYNSEWTERAIESGSWARDIRGDAHYMGTYEYEGCYRKFCTWGAKKYAFTAHDGRVGLTVAGVNKVKGALELERAGGIESFKPGFVFKDGGGLASTYNDEFDYGYYIREDGRRFHISSNVALIPSTYTLGLGSDYESVLYAYSIDRNRDVVYNNINY